MNIRNENFVDLIRTLSEKELREVFQDEIDAHLEKIGQLSKDELTMLQERVNVYKEIREAFISIRKQANQKTTDED